ANRLLCTLAKCRCGIAIGEEDVGAMLTATPSKAGRCFGLFALDDVLPLRTSAPLAGEPKRIVAIMLLLVEFVAPATAPPLEAPKGNGKNRSALLAKPLCRPVADSTTAANPCEIPCGAGDIDGRHMAAD
ncbi:hypothetical protein Vretimale_12450, partial [Volvox reticuliferus]